jgi:hypothetical protein
VPPRARNEARILDRLTGIEGVPRFNAPLTTPTSIALGDEGGIGLAQTLGAKRVQPALVVCAYRDADLEVAPEFVAMQAKWERLGVAPPVLRLGDLEATDLAGMRAEIALGDGGESTGRNTGRTNRWQSVRYTWPAMRR